MTQHKRVNRRAGFTRCLYYAEPASMIPTFGRLLEKAGESYSLRSAVATRRSFTGLGMKSTAPALKASQTAVL